jgi:hypothetical protein
LEENFSEGFLGELAKKGSELIAHAAEFCEPPIFRSLHRGGIIEAPMDASGDGRKDGATLTGMVTDRDNSIECLPCKLVYGF